MILEKRMNFKNPDIHLICYVNESKEILSTWTFLVASALCYPVYKNGNHFTVIISAIFESGKCYISVTIFITVMWNTREEVEDGSRDASITGWLLAAGLTPEYRHLAG